MIIEIYFFSHQECLIYGSQNFIFYSFCFSLFVIGVCMLVILGSYGVDFSSTSTWYQSSRSSCPYSIYERFGLPFKFVFFLFQRVSFFRGFCLGSGGSLIFGSLWAHIDITIELRVPKNPYFHIRHIQFGHSWNLRRKYFLPNWVHFPRQWFYDFWHGNWEFLAKK